MKRPYYTAVLWVIIGVILSLSVAHAYQAENPGQRGEGIGHVSGITVTGIEYRLSSTDPTRVDAVTFDVVNFQGKIAVKLVSSSETYFPCTPQSNSHWLCSVGGVSISDIDALRVVANGNG